MSVFQLNDWWSVQVAGEEEFDVGGMCVGNVDNAEPPSDKIVVGSLRGFLRIYAPTRSGYRIEDLVIEEDMGAPVLQVMIGKFIPSTDSLGLAVLHPRKLAVYEVVPQGHPATYHTMRRVYEHTLGLEGGKHFTAFNMACGAFGGAKGRDMIVVQSLDGKLQVFEQSANAFTRQLVDCLLPGPLGYLSRLDAIVTATSACQAECYRYQVLAASSSQADATAAATAGSTTGAFGVSAVRNALMEWSLNLGEPCRQIEEGSFLRAGTTNPGSGSTGPGKGTPPEVLLLCDRSLFLLKESGGMIQQRRLEKEPCCFAKYVSGDAASGHGPWHNFLLACRDGTLQVYSEFNLVWAAKLPMSAAPAAAASAGAGKTAAVAPVPVQVAVAQFGDQRGLVVALDDAGRLTVGYMGTKPPLTAVPSSLGAGSGSSSSGSASGSAHRDLDYDRLDEEHRALLHVIREAQSESGGKAEPRDRLLIRSQVPRSLDTDGAGDVNLQGVALPPDLVQLSTFTGGAGGRGGGSSSSSNNAAAAGVRGYVKVCVKVYLTHSGDKAATNVSLVLSGPGFLHTVPKNVVIQRIGGTAASTPVMVKFFVYATKAQLPSGLDVQVVATYTAPGGEPRVATHAVTLPLHIACRPKAAAKNAAHKLTLDTAGAPALPLTELFDDFLLAASELGLDMGEVLGPAAANAMGFQLWASGGDEGADPAAQPSAPAPALVSILVSKNAGRYRLQSDSLPALFLVADELERRLNARLAQLGTVVPSSSSGGGGGRLVTCEDAYPLTEYFALIRSHWELRRLLAEQLAQLNDRAHQFRMVQKRLLVRFKDRNPAPLGGLDTLMRESYDALLGLSE